MIEDDDHFSETFFHYTFTASFVRLIDQRLLPSQITVKLGIDVLDDDGMEFALIKIKHWVQNHFMNCVAISSQNKIAFDAFFDGGVPRVENTMMITPGEPGDPHILLLLQSKLEALSDGAFIIVNAEIKSDNAEGMTVTYIGDACEELPEMSDWVEGPNWFTLPWWRRDDISTIDSIAPEGADLTVRPVWASTLEFLRTPQNSQPALILQGDFKPKIVGDDKK